MREIYINPDWTFKEAVDNLKALRNQYEEILRLFNYYDLHEKVEFKRKTCNSFYALKLEEWEKDKLWNYMNHFGFLNVLKGIAKRRKKTKRQK